MQGTVQRVGMRKGEAKMDKKKVENDEKERWRESGKRR
jgi:hypothetical protein